MKEIADRILNGEAVDIAENGATFYLSVSKYDDKYKVGFVSPNYVEEYFTCLNTKTMRDAGNKLIELADELVSRKRFKEGDKLCFIRPDGKIRKIIFFPNDAYHCGLLMSGNAFKTEAEAEAHKDDVLAKYQDLRDRGLI